MPFAFGTPMAYDEILVLADEIADALAYLHPSVVHRDLKSQNVLLDRDGRSKVCDFGIAKFKERTFLTTKNVQAGTPAYMAPELFRAQEANELVDVFSFGVLLWECFTGEVPWGEYSQVQVIFAVTVEGRRLPLSESMPNFLSRLISDCWVEQPSERPSFKQILRRIRRERHGDAYDDDHDDDHEEEDGGGGGGHANGERDKAPEGAPKQVLRKDLLWTTPPRAAAGSPTGANRGNDAEGLRHAALDVRDDDDSPRESSPSTADAHADA